MSNHQKETFQNIPQKGFFGHPRGLFTLFFTEFWERFSYYGMRAILIYYLYTEVTKGGLGFDQTTANSIMAVYGSLVYMSGIIGGWIADRLLGTANTVFYGGVLIMFGHILLSFPGSVPAFFISMLLIIIGTGLLKPNVSSVVGDLYSPEDTRRDSGFSIFYMGINLGGFLAPIIVGTVGQTYNYHLGFSLAAIGMLFGLLTYLATRKKNLGSAGRTVPNPLTPAERKMVFGRIGIGVLVIAAIFGYSTFMGWMTIELFTMIVSCLGILIPLIYFIVMFKSSKTTSDERSRLTAYIPLFVASMMFWAIQEQGANILATYADKRTHLEFLGVQLHSSWFQSLNPLFIVVLAPVFAWIWMRLGNRQPSTPTKFSLGLILAGLSFVVMIFPAYINGTESLANPMWLVLSFLIVVLGELCLSPVGLSATSKLAPAAFSAQTMSLWFLSNASAQAINAQIVRFYSVDTEIAYFGIIGGVSILLGIILMLLSPKIQKFMKGVN
ncbi:peptide MFS transporter [Bacillus haynesii]|uniref:peptide MFS transporter n=1 Tax=Bacillus haynesii TaxID=1925021 RepID=UPI00227DC01E|nr:peptide MFS transporter [Bacillus haynesii]MCY7752991.1 peptide MFS transporter [Bacillus haynesii]MCY7861860.1 peptide MFS transporter [Bacillus haynesii]MCY8003466.1 peptide MFS transporter [Bacillus haynesii]MCY8102009.1 peptide MFS transporter [Bacillus haynesii]MCY8471189.1 peptide MFS transporter [Bacillus haynesii]